MPIEGKHVRYYLSVLGEPRKWLTKGGPLMPINIKATYICDTCGRSKESDGVPPDWKLARSYNPSAVTCPVCLMKEAKEEYHRLVRAANKIFEEEAVRNDTPPGKTDILESFRRHVSSEVEYD